MPVLAKLLEHIQSPLVITVFGSNFSLSLELPFSWYLFYFSALFFALGVLLYVAFCPRLISEFANFHEFIDRGGEGFRLEEEMEKAIPNGMVHDSIIWQAYLETARRVDCNEERHPGTTPDWVVKKALRQIAPSELFSLFYAIRTVADHSHPHIVRVNGISFLIGAILLGIVLVQNMWFVIVQLLCGIQLQLPWL